MVNYDFLSVYFYSVPNLRFLKFNQNYETLQLKNTLKIKSGKDQKQVEVENGIYNIYGTGGIIGHTNTFLYDKESVGIGRKGTIDKPVYFDQPFWTVDTLFYSEIYEGFIPKYIFYLFQTINWKKYNTSTGVPSLTSSSIENIEKSFPCYDEQLKVANFLTMIDMRIETQIKIIDSYFSLSKAISNTLIGQSKGNTRLRECLNCYSSNTMESVIKQEDLGDYPVYGANGIIKKINNYEIEYPSIAIVKDGSGVGKMFKLSGKYSILSTLNYLTSKPGYDIDYIYYALKQKSLKKYVVGSGIPHIYFKDYEQEKIYIPQNELQQQNITSVLQSIDEEIGNEIKQLKNYELLKKYLLKNMFV